MNNITDNGEDENGNQILNNKNNNNNNSSNNKYSISKYKFDEKLETFFINLTNGGKDTNGKPTLFTPLVPKILYFFLFYLFGTQRPFVPLFFKSIGIEPSTLGIILLFPPLISFIFSPIFSGLADKINAHKLIFLLMTFGTGICFFSLNFIRNKLLATFIVLLNSVFWAPMIPIIDSTCYKILGNSNKELYGKQRMYGSIGFCVSAFMTGALITKFDTINVAWINYPIGSIVLFTFTLLCYNSKPIEKLFEKLDPSTALNGQLLETLNSPNNSNYQQLEQEESLVKEDNGITDGAEKFIKPTDTDTISEKQQEGEGTDKKYTFIEGVTILVSNPRIAIILFNCIIIACGMSVCNNYLALTITDERYFNAPPSLVGIASILNVTFEIMFFYFGKQLLMKIGVFKLIIISHICLVARVVSYSFLLRLHMVGWSIVPVELLHGIVFASIWNSGSSIINANSPPGLEATGQSLLFGIYMGFGTSIGALLGGILYEGYGPITMFEFVAAVVIFGLLVFLLTELLLFNKNAIERKRQIKKEQEVSDIHDKIYCVRQHKRTKQPHQHQQLPTADNGRGIDSIVISVIDDEDKEEEELNLRFNQLLKDELKKQKEIEMEEEAQYNNLIINDVNDEILNNSTSLI